MANQPKPSTEPETSDSEPGFDANATIEDLQRELARLRSELADASGARQNSRRKFDELSALHERLQKRAREMERHTAQQRQRLAALQERLDEVEPRTLLERVGHAIGHPARTLRKLFTRPRNTEPGAGGEAADALEASQVESATDAAAPTVASTSEPATGIADSNQTPVTATSSGTKTDAPPAVFVVGSPRSGTSALSWALAAHAAFETGPEADFPFFLARGHTLRQAYQEARKRSDGWLAVHGVSLEHFLSAIGNGVDHLFSSSYGAAGWVDSTPANVLVCDDLALMVPRARFLHIVRDGRAAVASMQASNFDARIAHDFEHAVKTWADYATRGNQFSKTRPDICLQLRQEELVEDPAGVMQRILEFLRVPQSDAPAEFLSRGRINSSYGNERKEDIKKAKSPDQLPKQPWTEWTSREKDLFRTLATDAMNELGYSMELE